MSSPAEAPAEAVAEDGKPVIEWHLNLDNLFLFRNDRDFDRTPPAYDESGQTEGAFATVFRPNITFNIDKNLKVFYEIELGLNYWSKNNPDQENALAADIFVLKHRQSFAEGAVLDGIANDQAGFWRDMVGESQMRWLGPEKGIVHMAAAALRRGCGRKRSSGPQFRNILAPRWGTARP